MPQRSDEEWEGISKELVASILRQAADDWRSLDYGRFREQFYTGGIVRRSELLQFFRSEMFEKMCLYVGLQSSPNKIRKALRIETEEK